MFASPVGIIRRVWQPVSRKCDIASVAKTEHAVVWPPHVKRYFCAHLPAPSARGIIRGEQQQQQEASFFALLPPGTSLGSMKSLVRCDWTHAVENVTYYIATVAVVRPRVSIWYRARTYILWPAPRLRVKKKHLMFKFSYTLLRISLYRILSFMSQNKTACQNAVE